MRCDAILRCAESDSDVLSSLGSGCEFEACSGLDDGFSARLVFSGSGLVIEPESMKSSSLNQPEVSIQNVLLSPCPCNVFTISEIACESNRCNRFDGVNGVRRKIGSVDGAEL